jgi:chemotaxis protein MotB
MAAHEEEQDASVPDWVVTFSDMMSLLLTFFVMLVSMSEIKQEESLVLIESLRRQFGPSRASLSLAPGRLPPTSAAVNKLTSLGRARRADTMNGGDKVQAPHGDYARVMAIRPSDESTVGGVIYFDEGDDTLSQKSREVLRETARAIAGKPQKIEIRGHTSSRPLDPGSSFRSHWELAHARALKAMQYLVSLGIDPKRIRISSAAANEPVHVGYDELLRKRNARVEVLLLDSLTEDLQGNKKRPAQTQPSKTNAPGDEPGA